MLVLFIVKKDGVGGVILPCLSPVSDFIFIKMIRNVLKLFKPLFVCLNVIYFYFIIYILFIDILYLFSYLF